MTLRFYDMSEIMTLCNCDIAKMWPQNFDTENVGVRISGLLPYILQGIIYSCYMAHWSNLKGHTPATRMNWYKYVSLTLLSRNVTLDYIGNGFTY